MKAIYIDGNNLYRAAKELEYSIDYKKFRGWLRQKYKPTHVYLFIGFVAERSNFYRYLQDSGYILIFKQTISTGIVVKGNCDAELVLRSLDDFHTNIDFSAILITGDGDFGCLVEYFRDRKVFDTVIAPDRKKCSLLLKNKNTPITFLNDHYHKFSK